MCIALPGRVVRIDGKTAEIDYSGLRTTVALGLVDARAGDYVLVHAGCAIEVMAPELARDLLELVRELEEASDVGRP
jgi:hydrogenase expression/formation protein HypC